MSADVEYNPTIKELPSGELVFSSTRIKSFNVCAVTLSTALFAVRRDEGR